MTPGKTFRLPAERDFRITNAALGDKLADKDGRSTIKLLFHDITADDSDEDEDDESKAKAPLTETILCSLTPGKVC